MCVCICVYILYHRYNSYASFFFFFFFNLLRVATIFTSNIYIYFFTLIYFFLINNYTRRVYDAIYFIIFTCALSIENIQEDCKESKIIIDVSEIFSVI